MRAFRPADYGPVLAPLVSGDRCRSLDSGQADPALRPSLALATPESAFAQTPVADRDMAACCIAGLWLVHDYLDESHAISQNIDTPTAAFWHGVMHRREGDFSNAKYWFRRAGRHEALVAGGAGIAELGHQLGAAEHAKRLMAGEQYDPAAMVDACQAALRSGDPAAAAFLRRVQQAEWELLFDFSYRSAVAA